MNKKIFRNTFFLFGSQILSRTISFFYFVFLARSLSVANLGIYAWVLGFGYNFYPLADFGLERVVLKYIPRYPSETSLYLSRLFSLRLFLALGSVLVSVVLGLLMGVGKQRLFYIFTFGLALLPYNLLYLYAAFKNAQEKAEVYAAITILTSLLSSLFGIGVVYLGLGLGWLFAVYFLANTAVLILLLLRAPKLGLPVSWKIEISFWKRILKEAWIFAGLTTLAVFYLRTSVILLGIFKGDYLTGLYSSAFKFLEAMILIPQSLALAFFPLSSRLFVGNKAKLKEVYKKGVLILFLIAFPFATVLIFFPKTIVDIVYGENYLPVIPVFPVLGIAAVLFFMNALAGNVIQNSPRVRQFLPFLGLNFIIEIILCLILIPRYSILGAAWAVVGGESFALLINNLFVIKILKER